MDWAQILVIVLAVLFAFFLLAATVLAVLLIKVTRQIKEVSASAERTVHAIEGSMNAINKSALPLIVAKKIVEQVSKKSQNKKGG
jgi:uncharacterized protein YoxC